VCRGRDARIGHVQIADAPGRLRARHGEIQLDRYLSALGGGGYTGWVGLEYQQSITRERPFSPPSAGFQA
jgi:hydroxypyruvate isomerase